MHIAVGITLCDRKTGAHCKITEVGEKLILLHDTANDVHHTVFRTAMTEYYEEFGPLYEFVKPGHPLVTSEVQLSRCPFCGSTNLDAAAWMSDADVNNTGPGCDDCGATARSVELWNTRYTPEFDEAACRQAWENLYHKVRAEAPYDVFRRIYKWVRS